MISELYLNSVKMLKKNKIKVEYADPNKLNFSYKDNTIHIYSGEKDFPNIKQIIDWTIESTEFSNGRKEISLHAWQNKGKCASSTVDYLLEVQKTVLNSLK